MAPNDLFFFVQVEIICYKHSLKKLFYYRKTADLGNILNLNLT
jgi:hypothetical protein